MSFKIETKRLVLRPPVLNDATALARWINDPAVANQTGGIPHPYSALHAEFWILTRPSAWRRRLEHTTVVERHGAVIGTASLFRASRDDHFSLGYMLARDHWGQGLMSEAVGGLLDVADREWGAGAIDASVFVDNPASIAILERHGFERTGELSLYSAGRCGHAPGLRYRRPAP